MSAGTNPHFGEWDLESEVENYFRKECIKADILVRKTRWDGRRGAPDRMLLTKSGILVWVEIKRPGGAAVFPKDAHERAQAREHALLRSRGQRVTVIDCKAHVDALIAHLTAMEFV